jgi:hypothetical protein
LEIVIGKNFLKNLNLVIKISFNKVKLDGYILKEPILKMELQFQGYLLALMV